MYEFTKKKITMIFKYFLIFQTFLYTTKVNHLITFFRMHLLVAICYLDIPSVWFAFSEYQIDRASISMTIPYFFTECRIRKILLHNRGAHTIYYLLLKYTINLMKNSNNYYRIEIDNFWYNPSWVAHSRSSIGLANWSCPSIVLLCCTYTTFSKD